MLNRHAAVAVSYGDGSPRRAIGRMNAAGSILQPRRNCWRIERSPRLAWLIDAAAYYEALYHAFCAAHQSILIVGWDIDSRIELLRGAAPQVYPVRLGQLLNALLEERDALQVHVLGWDFAMIYALERSWLPLYQFSLGSHARLHFQLDDEHPLGASHHQKIVVVDDTIAWCGGIDLTKARWDTPAHRPDDPRRRAPDDRPHGPFHDVQAMVCGAAAGALGELARQRWQSATGTRIDPPRARSIDELWPSSAAIDAHDCAVGIARTRPVHRGLAERREIERLYVDAIAAARRYIYLENQYLTSAAVAVALERSLDAAEGPELVIVLPRETSGWLEQLTMDVLRARLLQRLRGADRHGRLAVLCPHADDLAQPINVHSKLMIADDRFVQLGSANLSNRSMGLDTECNLALEAADDAQRQAVRRLLHRLLAEHCGGDVERVAALIDAGDSLRRAIGELRGGQRRLVPLDGRVAPQLDELVPQSALIDPERPVRAEALLGELVEEHLGREPAEPVQTRRRIVPALVTLALLLSVAALWQFSPLGDWLTIERLGSVIRDLQGRPWAPLAALGAFIAGGLLIAPVTALIALTVLVFGAVAGFLYSLAGAASSAALSYGIGAMLGRRTIRQLAGPRVNRISERLGEQSLLTIAALRMLPVAPFTVVNVVAGASHIRFWTYIGGTLIGLLPGTAAIAFVVSGASAAIDRPGLGTVGLLIAGLGVLALGVVGLRAWLRARLR